MTQALLCSADVHVFAFSFGGGSQGAAAAMAMDDMLPAFFLCITRAGPARLRSDLAYMQQFALARLPAITEVAPHSHTLPFSEHRTVSCRRCS